MQLGLLGGGNCSNRLSRKSRASGCRRIQSASLADHHDRRLADEPVQLRAPLGVDR